MKEGIHPNYREVSVRGPVQRFQVRDPFVREHQGNRSRWKTASELPLYKLDTSS